MSILRTVATMRKQPGAGPKRGKLQRPRLKRIGYESPANMRLGECNALPHAALRLPARSAL